MGNLQNPPRLHTMKPPALVLPAFSSGSVFLRSRCSDLNMDIPGPFGGSKKRRTVTAEVVICTEHIEHIHIMSPCHIHFGLSWKKLSHLSISLDVRMLAGRHKMLVPIKLLGSSQNGNCFLVWSMVADAPHLSATHCCYCVYTIPKIDTTGMSVSIVHHEWE